MPAHNGEVPRSVTLFRGTGAEIRLTGWRYRVVLGALAAQLAFWLGRLAGASFDRAWFVPIDVAVVISTALAVMIIIGPLRPGDHR